MFNPLLIQEIFSQPWCINNQYLHGLAMTAYSLMSAQNKSMPALPDGAGHQTQKQAFNYSPVHAFAPHSSVKQTGTYAPGSVGIVEIDGPIVQHSDSWYGIKGTLEAAEEFLALEADPNIIGTVFVNNSGGGAVYAIKPLDDVMASLKKPVVNWSREMVASAAYRLGARTQHMMMYHPHGIAGSLGTMSSFSDMQPMFEKWGMKFFEYYASASVLKNATYNNARKGDGTALISNVLDPMNEEFLSSIRKLRGDKITDKDKSIFQGETFLATEAVKLGLIDSLGELSDAINLVAELAGQATTQSTQSQKFYMKTPKLHAIAGKTALSETELDEINAELLEQGVPKGYGMYPESIVNDAEAVTKERDNLQTQLTTANGQVTTLTNQVKTLNEEKSALEAKVAAGPAITAPKVGGEDTSTEKSEAEKTEENISGFSHNQYADQFLNY